jgi:hypothetical protein
MNTEPESVEIPIVHAENNRLRVEFPAGLGPDQVYPVAGAVIQGWADQINKLRDQLDSVLAAGDALAAAQLRARLPGYCPMGCGQHLFVGAGGFITCSWIDCPRPDAVSTLLEDRETEHVVLFGRAGFTVRHPLRERLDDQLMTCGLQIWCTELDGPLDTSGPVRMHETTDGEWEVI